MRVYQCLNCTLEFEHTKKVGPLPLRCPECLEHHVKLYQKLYAQHVAAKCPLHLEGRWQRPHDLRDTNASRVTEFILVAKQAQGLIYMGRAREAYDLLGDVLDRRSPSTVIDLDMASDVVQ